MKKKNNFWSNGVSIDETRISTLILLTILFSGIGIWAIFKVGDIPPNLVTVLIALITAIAGINIADKIVNRPTTTAQPVERYDEEDNRGTPTI